MRSNYYKILITFFILGIFSLVFPEDVQARCDLYQRVVMTVPCSSATSGCIEHWGSWGTCTGGNCFMDVEDYSVIPGTGNLLCGQTYDDWRSPDTGCFCSDPIIPTANIQGYITLDGGGRVGQSTSSDGGYCSGTASCDPPGPECGLDTGNCVTSGTCNGFACNPVIPGVNISIPGSTINPSWWCPSTIIMQGQCNCSDSWWFCRNPVDTNGLNFSFNSLTKDQTQTFSVSGVPAGYTCNYTFTINGTPTSGTGCSFTSPVLPEGTHQLVVDLYQSPMGTILGRVVNKAKEDLGMAAKYVENPDIACGTSSEVANVSIGFTGTSTVNTTPGVCISSLPAYSQSLNVGTYTVTANVPTGWEATGWSCTSIKDGVQGGLSCPGGVNYVNSPTGGGTVNNVPLNADVAAHIWFWIRPIAPSCTISGSSKVSMGSTWWGSATTTVKGLGGAEGVADTEIAIDKSSLTSLGTRIGTTSEPDECSNSSTCNITRFWTPADIDIGNTYNFYCRGNNSTNWVTPLRQCRPYLYGAYPADVDCFNGTKNSTCLGSGTDCIPVEVTDTDAWFQVQGGDTHGQLGITSFIPTTATNPLFNLDLNTYPGLVSYSSPNTYDFSADLLSDGLNYSSSKKWLAQSGFTSNITNFYTHYLDKMKNNIDPSVFDCSGTHNFNNQGIKVYSVTGDCAIGNNWNVSGTSKIVVLVSGNLTLSGNSTTITVDPGSFLSFIVQGNMTVDDNLGNKQLANNPFIQGVYIVNGTITTGTAANMSGNRFIGGGTFYGKSGFNLGRDLKPNGCSGHACNSYTPAELFIFRPDLVVNTPYELWSSKINWQEVVP